MKTEEIGRIFRKIELRIPSHIEKTFSRPSKLFNSKKISIDGMDRLKYWKSKLKRDEIESILKIVHSFEIDIYTDNITLQRKLSF